jgi:predicted thioesterase
MRAGLEPGASWTQEWVVTPEMSPPHLDAEVLSTPWMLALAEWASHHAVGNYLEEHENAVGTAFTIRHLAVARAGETVTVRSEVTQVGRRLRFAVTVDGPRGPVGTLDVEFAVIDERRFAR